MLRRADGTTITSKDMRLIRAGVGGLFRPAVEQGDACAADAGEAGNFYTRHELCVWCGVARLRHNNRRRR